MNNLILDIDNSTFSDKELVTILELIIYKLDIKSISEMARHENKSPNGIRKSNNYRKVKIGKTILCTSKLKNNLFPF